MKKGKVLYKRGHDLNDETIRPRENDYKPSNFGNQQTNPANGHRYETNTGENSPSQTFNLVRNNENGIPQAIKPPPPSVNDDFQHKNNEENKEAIKQSRFMPKNQKKIIQTRPPNVKTGQRPSESPLNAEPMLQPPPHHANPAQKPPPPYAEPMLQSPPLNANPIPQPPPLHSNLALKPPPLNAEPMLQPPPLNANPMPQPPPLTGELPLTTPSLFMKSSLKEFLNDSSCLVCGKKLCNFVSPCQHTYHLKCVFSDSKKSFQCKNCSKSISLEVLVFKNRDLCYICQGAYNLFQCKHCYKKYCYSCILNNDLVTCCEALKNGIRNLRAICPGCHFERSVNDLVHFSCYCHDMLCKKCWNLSTELNKCILGHDLNFKHQDVILCSNCNKSRIRGYTEYYCNSDCQYCDICTSKNLLSQPSRFRCICGLALKSKQGILWN